jgi:hypothetical protein
MNPYLARKLTDQHAAELRLDAHKGRPRVTRQRAPNSRQPRSVRHRAGWTLVTIGLRLAATADDA